MQAGKARVGDAARRTGAGADRVDSTVDETLAQWELRKTLGGAMKTVWERVGRWHRMRMLRSHRVGMRMFDVVSRHWERLLRRE